MKITDEKITEYINSYYRPLNERLGEFRRVNEANEVPLILKETESFLSVLMDILRPDNILEIGTAYGYSALFFACKRQNAHITTIDRGRIMIPIAEENFSKWPEGERIKFLQGDAADVLAEMIKQGNREPFDFVFIDAGKSHYREFFDAAEKLCRPGATIVCDNILMRGWIVDRSIEGGKRHRTNIKYMKRFIEYINGREDLSVSLLSSGDGLAVIKLNE